MNSLSALSQPRRQNLNTLSALSRSRRLRSYGLLLRRGSLQSCLLCCGLRGLLLRRLLPGHCQLHPGSLNSQLCPSFQNCRLRLFQALFRHTGLALHPSLFCLISNNLLDFMSVLGSYGIRSLRGVFCHYSLCLCAQGLFYFDDFYFYFHSSCDLVPDSIVILFVSIVTFFCYCDLFTYTCPSFSPWSSCVFKSSVFVCSSSCVNLSCWYVAYLCLVRVLLMVFHCLS